MGEQQGTMGGHTIGVQKHITGSASNKRTKINTQHLATLPTLVKNILITGFTLAIDNGRV